MNASNGDLSKNLRIYADQVPVVMSLHNLKHALLDAADEIDESRKTIEELREELASAASTAGHLMQMIDPQTWRDNGGDDGQGHYEGDYRAAQVANCIERWRVLANEGGTE
jgi:hypothetical protein